MTNGRTAPSRSSASAVGPLFAPTTSYPWLVSNAAVESSVSSSSSTTRIGSLRLVDTPHNCEVGRPRTMPGRGDRLA